jgi:hypothetical protein
MDMSHLSLAELFDLKSAVNKAINHRISSAADDFIWQLCAHYGVDLSQFKQASRRQYADIKRIASYYFVSMKGLSQSEAAEIIGISRVTVAQHVAKVQHYKRSIPGKWFAIFNTIQSVTK